MPGDLCTVNAFTMSAIIILITCSLIVALGFLVAFIIGNRSGQFDDLETPAMRMLFDDTIPVEKAPLTQAPMAKDKAIAQALKHTTHTTNT
jgi:cbb3-type cytochrome oxidase maturation protein